MKKDIKLYNVIFPVWMLILFPMMWLIVIPANFVVDSLVLIGCMHFLKIDNKKSFYLKKIFWIFGFGFLADIIGSGLMLLAMMFTPIGNYVEMADELFLTIPALVVAAALIFVLNYFVTFKKDEKNIRLKISLIFAIVTAPYLYLFPSSWVY